MAVKTPSNIEYLGPKPNFTRDSFNTLEDMQNALEEGHIDEGHLSYCKETGITYKATKDTLGDLVWTDSLGDLDREIKEIIIDNEKVTSEALSDLNSRLSAVEREITDVEDEGMGENTRLDQVYEWFDIQTHIPVLSSVIQKTSSGNLRRGTTHTYDVIFNWDWANREPGVTGLTVVNGETSETRTFSDLQLNPFVLGGSYTWPITVNLGNSAITIKSGFFNTEVQGSSQVTVTPLTPTYTWSITGLPGTWEAYDPSKQYTMIAKVVGKNLPEDSVGDKVKSSISGVIGTVSAVSDSNLTFSESMVISANNGIIPEVTWTWETSSGTTRSEKTYSPLPSLFLVSSQKNAGTDVSGYSAGYQSYLSAGATTIPERTYTAGSTGLYLSPYDIRDYSVQSLASGSSTWVTIAGFNVSGTVIYAGKTYYYLMNPNIGAGKFQFKFA